MILISKTRPLEYMIGADESNHGRYPTIFVAVSSIHPEDRKYHVEEIPKKRFKCRNEKDAGKKIKEILECRQYRFLLLYESHTSYLGLNAPKIPAFGQVLSSFEHRDPVRVFIDGSGNNKDKEDLSHIISKVTSAEHKIRFAKKGDLHFPIINKADAIANILYKLYQHLGENETGPFDENRVYFGIEKSNLSKKEKKNNYTMQRHRS